MTDQLRLAHAAGLLVRARSTLTDGAFELAYHVAVPVVVTPAFVHLVRTNFFLDPPVAVSYEDESRLLLSALCRDVGEGCYDIDPDLRRLLLVGLLTRFNAQRLRAVASLLERYCELGDVWGGLPELEQAQRLTALSLLKPAVADEWLARHEAGPGSGGDLGPQWCVAMRRRLADHPREGHRLAEEIAWTWCGPSLGGRLLNSAAYTALASLPGVEKPKVVAALQDVASRTGTDATTSSVARIVALLSPPARPEPDAPRVPTPPLPTLGPAPTRATERTPPRPAPTAVPPPPTGTAAATSVMIVGPPGAGKTTFAATLAQAALGFGDEDAPWSLHALPPAGDQTLEAVRSHLFNGRFPPPSLARSPRFRLVGEVDDPAGRGTPGGTRRAVDCTVEVLDGLPLHYRSGPDEMLAGQLARLAAADAVVYIIDPIHDLTGGPDHGANFQYFNVLLELWTAELHRQDPTFRGRLPQQVAVCLAKFDDPRVFEPAVAAGLVELPEGRGPYVPAGRTLDYFDWLCAAAPPLSNLSLLRDGMPRSFLRDRVSYSVTSSIGFFRTHGASSLADYRNIAVTADGHLRLRGPIRPLNVIEPVMLLERRVMEVR